MKFVLQILWTEEVEHEAVECCRSHGVVLPSMHQHFARIATNEPGAYLSGTPELLWLVGTVVGELTLIPGPADCDNPTPWKASHVEPSSSLKNACEGLYLLLFLECRWWRASWMSIESIATRIADRVLATSSSLTYEESWAWMSLLSRVVDDVHWDGTEVGNLRSRVHSLWRSIGPDCDPNLS